MNLRGALAVLLVALLLKACGGAPPHPEAPAGPPVATPGGSLDGAYLPALIENPELCRFALGHSGVGFTPKPDKVEVAGCGLVGGGAFVPTSMSFDREVTASCGLIAGLAVWEREVLQPAAQRHFGQPVREVRHWGTYACRNRNGKQAGPRSEHARANAIDIHAFMLSDGSVISVRHDWGGKGPRAAFLREVHLESCSVFRGVLGPEADAAHRDHFHFDMGRWTFCR